MPILTDVRLLRKFEKITGNQVGFLREIAEATAPLDETKLDEIVHKLTADRFALAQEIFATAKLLDINSPGGQRAAISRSYYAMYQASRAIVFHYERSDIDNHHALPQRLPDKLPNSKHWADRLVDWRKKRDEVDYSPYPRGALDVMAAEALREAEDFLNLCGQFLIERGCIHV